MTCNSYFLRIFVPVKEELQMEGLHRLRQKYGLGEARALYELVMQQRFNLSRNDILLGKDTTLSAKDKAELQIILDRMADGEPVQYVLGYEEFCGRMYMVNSNVLIPRPETQQLVRLVERNVAVGESVLDIGTGSGCIAITLSLLGFKTTAFDVSKEALDVAKQNAKRLGAEVCFECENILQPKSYSKHWKAIVSNPPYICVSEANEMDDNVFCHEPHLALFVPDDDPLLFYRAIAEFGCKYIESDGWLFFEVNRAYARQVEALLLQKGYKETQIVKDQYDNDRFVCARKK